VFRLSPDGNFGQREVSPSVFEIAGCALSWVAQVLYEGGFMFDFKWGFSALSLAVLMVSTAHAALPAQCQSQSGAKVMTVIELYTSEGCSSCPPADRWLSQFKTSADVIPLAFHVDYWAQLGWHDRFSKPAYEQRQTQQQAINGASFSYTPQVVVQGQDEKNWSAMALNQFPLAQESKLASNRPIEIKIMRDGNQISAKVKSADAQNLAAYWAVTENGLSSQVKAGENKGFKLNHDAVVLYYQAVSTWQAAAGQTQTLTLVSAPPDLKTSHQTVNLVVINAQSGRPVQALKLGC
jgi:hypothetical protein